MTPDLDGLWDELRRGDIYECSLKDVEFHLDGLQSGQRVYIDPRPSILETLLHELIHRRHPRLGERTVERRARQLLSSMSDQTKARWWSAYQRTKRRCRAVQTSED